MRRRGFTLIELLIVVAIIAIITASTMALLILPLQEHAVGEIQVAVDRGMARTIPRLMEDVREATRAEAKDQTLHLYAHDDGQVVWSLGSDGILRREVLEADGESDPGNAAPILEQVGTFEPAVDSDVVTVQLAVGFEKLDHRFYQQQSLTIPMATAWRHKP